MSGDEAPGDEAAHDEESSRELRVRKRNANYDRLIALPDARKLQEAGEAAGQALALEPAEEAAWEGQALALEPAEEAAPGPAGLPRKLRGRGRHWR